MVEWLSFLSTPLLNLNALARYLLWSSFVVVCSEWQGPERLRARGRTQTGRARLRRPGAYECEPRSPDCAHTRRVAVVCSYLPSVVYTRRRTRGRRRPLLLSTTSTRKVTRQNLPRVLPVLSSMSSAAMLFKSRLDADIQSTQELIVFCHALERVLLPLPKSYEVLKRFLPILL